MNNEFCGHRHLPYHLWYKVCLLVWYKGILAWESFYKSPNSGIGQIPVGRNVNHPYLKYVSIPVKMNHSSFRATKQLLVFPKYGAVFVAQL